MQDTISGLFIVMERTIEAKKYNGFKMKAMIAVAQYDHPKVKDSFFVLG